MSSSTSAPTSPGPGPDAGAADRAQARSAAPRRGGRRPNPVLRRRLELLLLIGPAAALFSLFVLLPVVQAAYFSVYNWNGLGPLDRFIGLGNYREALTDSVFRDAVGHTLLVVVLSVLVQLPLGLGIALLLNRRIRGRTVLRLVIFVPYVLSEVIAGVVWLLMLQPNGFVDRLLEVLGLGGLVQLWLGDPDVALFTVFGVLTWKYLGLAIILFLAGLSGVPEELNEAASLDGATWWETQRHITVPLLAPTIRIWAFLSMVGSLQLFDMVYILTGGGPANATSTMATYLIGQGFERYRFGYGSAVAVVMFAISFVLAMVYQRFVLNRDNVEATSGRKA